MKTQVRPELAMIAAWLPPATLTDMHSPAPPMIRPESTYKSGIVVQTTGATSNDVVKELPTKRFTWMLKRVMAKLMREVVTRFAIPIACSVPY